MQKYSSDVKTELLKIHACLYIDDRVILETDNIPLFEISFDYYLEDYNTMRVGVNYIYLLTQEKNRRTGDAEFVDLTAQLKNFAENLIWKHLQKTDYKLFLPLQNPEEYICGADLEDK